MKPSAPITRVTPLAAGGLRRPLTPAQALRIGAIGSLLIALAVAAYRADGDDDEIARPLPRRVAASAAVAAAAPAAPRFDTARMRFSADLIRDPFGEDEVAPPPVASAAVPKQPRVATVELEGPAQAPPPPPPPAIGPPSHRVLGLLEAGPQAPPQVLLEVGDGVQVLKAGDALDTTYRLETIAPQRLTWLHLPSQTRVTTPLANLRP